MLEKLLESLRERPSSATVFNQYEDDNTLNNLRQFLDYLLKHRHGVLLLGEAPGYRGCRLTGIPFTSGSVIRESIHEIFRQIGGEIKLAKVDTEATASIFWEFFGTNRPIPILWNAFPFHPHIADDPETNRKPTRLEIEEGKRYLEMLCGIFRPRRLCSLGRVGQVILSNMFPKHEITYIRHPSRGGKKAFNKGMEKVISYFT